MKRRTLSEKGMDGIGRLASSFSYPTSKHLVKHVTVLILSLLVVAGTQAQETTHELKVMHHETGCAADNNNDGRLRVLFEIENADCQKDKFEVVLNQDAKRVQSKTLKCAGEARKDVLVYAAYIDNVDNGVYDVFVERINGEPLVVELARNLEVKPGAPAPIVEIKTEEISFDKHGELKMSECFAVDHVGEIKLSSQNTNAFKNDEDIASAILKLTSTMTQNDEITLKVKGLEACAHVGIEKTVRIIQQL